MAARLKRLEGMVREMIDEEGAGDAAGSSSRRASVKKSPSSDADASLPRRPQQHQQRLPLDGGELAAEEAEEEEQEYGEDRPGTQLGGKVVSAMGARGGSTAYVGATHFMAMLDDVGLAACMCLYSFLNKSGHIYITSRQVCARGNKHR